MIRQKENRHLAVRPADFPRQRHAVHSAEINIKKDEIKRIRAGILEQKSGGV